ncbi:MAG: 50S ribosomal protein L3 [Patescibacteria group bacterium]
MKFLLGKKLEMTQTFLPNGRVVPVTIILAGQCTVTQVKTTQTDGYAAVQVGFGLKKRNVTKSKAGHLKELPPFRVLREFRVSDPAAWTRGTTFDVSAFAPGELVTVAGTVKGRGFQGVVKRHGFAGHPSTHGHKDQERMPGSISAGGVQHVFKGKRMAGRMGGNRVTVKALEVIAVDIEHNRLVLSGSVPGARGSLLLIRAHGGAWSA